EDAGVRVRLDAVGELAIDARDQHVIVAVERQVAGVPDLLELTDGEQLRGRRVWTGAAPDRAAGARGRVRVDQVAVRRDRGRRHRAEHVEIEALVTRRRID